MTFYRVRRYKKFPIRSDHDVVEKSFENLKQAQDYSIKLNLSEDSKLYNTKWYVETVK